MQTATVTPRERQPLNGVDTPNLFATITAVKGAPELAKFCFRARNRWLSGTHSESTIESFTGAGGPQAHSKPFRYDADHPAVLVGGDKGPTPVEFLLHALAACLTAGIANVAAARNRHADRGRVHGRRRHRPAGHPWALADRTQRLPADPGELHPDDLVATTAAADVKLAVLLSRIDAFITGAGLTDVPEGDPVEPAWPHFVDAPTTLDLDEANVRSVVWATGFRRRYPWLKVPVLDARGEIRHHGGITSVPGLYVLGLPFLRRRNSAFIDGVGHDATALAGHVIAYLAARTVHRRAIA